MEAVWSRFLPTLVKVRELVGSGAIGEVRMIQSDFGFRAGFNPKGRLFDPHLGGGALLDVGIYNLSLSSMIFGPPTEVKTLAQLGDTGVDEQAAIILMHEGGRIAVSSTAIRTTTLHEAVLFGTEGWIRIDKPWWRSNGLTLTVHGEGDTRFETPMTSNGYNYEAEEVMACLRAGKLESAVMPLDETVSTMKTMDKIRAQWGLRYPME
jgi:predicted dehydrogenase